MTQVNTKVNVLKKKMLGNKQMDDQFHKKLLLQLLLRFIFFWSIDIPHMS